MRRLLCLPFFILVLAAACLALEQPEPTNAEEAAAQKAKAAAELDAKYQAWVATLTPERQAWERLLRSELGGFYLPIHQQQKVAGQANTPDHRAACRAPEAGSIRSASELAYSREKACELTTAGRVHCDASENVTRART